MYTFNFNSKAQYLQQKKEWHSAFLTQIKKIRDCKNNIKVAQRKGRSVFPAMQSADEARDELQALLIERWRSREQAYKQMKEENPSFHEMVAV